MGGPPLVFAATGERVTAEQLGGATLHCDVSGVTDHFAYTEEEAILKCRDIMGSLNLPGTFPFLANADHDNIVKFIFCNYAVINL